ncbi:MAG: amidohydrolase family protein, partial [bacterium]
MNGSAGLKIDVHVHVIATDRKAHGCFISKRSKYHPVFLLWKAINNYLGLSDGEFDRRYLEDLVKAIEECEGIDRAVVLGFDAVHDSRGEPDWNRTDEYTTNDYVLDIAGEFDCCLPGPSVHPARRDALDELERCAELGAVLVKWVPNSQWIDPSDARYAGFYEKLADLNLPLLSHTGYEHTVRAPNQDYGDPERLERALDAGVTVIAAHSGASGIGHSVEYFPRYVKMLEKYPNLYGDLSAFTTPSRAVYLRRIANNPLLTGRSIQGSDYPVPPMPILFARQLGPNNLIKLWREKNYF